MATLIYFNKEIFINNYGMVYYIKIVIEAYPSGNLAKFTHFKKDKEKCTFRKNANIGTKKLIYITFIKCASTTNNLLSMCHR